jgi:hypothetical protein
MDQIIVLVVIGAIIILVPVLSLMFLAALAVAIFIWRKIFPLGWGIAEWITNRRNFIPFVLFMLIVQAAATALLIGAYVFATSVHWIGFLFLLLVLIILFIAAAIFWGGLGLAITLWIVRLCHGAYSRFRAGFWRTFPPTGPYDLEPVPNPQANPSSVLSPPAKLAQRRRRRTPVGQRTESASSAVLTAEEKAQPRSKARAKRKAIAKVKTKGGPSKAQAGAEAKLAQAQANEGARLAEIQAKEEAKQAKAQAKEEARLAKIQAKEEARLAKIQDKEEAKLAKAQAKEDNGLAIVEDMERAGAQTEEETKLRRRRKLKRRK